jgi:hypothetical protein
MVLIVASGVAQAQEVCGTFGSLAATLPGFAGAKFEATRSGANVICELRSAKNDATLSLIVEPAQAARGLPMRKMLAVNGKEPGMVVKDEPTLGTGAFSFATKEQVSLTSAGTGGVNTLSLNRDAGLAAGDEAAVRAIAQRLSAG